MVNITKLGYFVGEYRHSLTERNRVALPKRIRVEIESNEVILSRGDKGTIEGFDKNQWTEIVKTHTVIPFTEEKGREIRRRVFATAMLVEIDAQGRIVLPENFLSWAGLKGRIGEPVAIIGVGDHFEIWENSAWEARTNT